MNIFISAVLIILVTSCNNTSHKESGNIDTVSSITDTAVVQSKNITLEGAWQLEPVLPSDTAAGKIPTIVFDLTTKKFQGNTGCNNMSGNFYTSGDSISFNEQILMTKMACPGYNEQGFIESLTRTNRYKIEKGSLQLMQDQTVLSKWIRKDSVVQKKI